MAEIENAIVLCIEDSCWVGANGEGTPMKRVFSPVGTVFKGSGFYRNDSRPAPKPEVPATKKATTDDA